jgi:hypothetical protein
MGIGRSTFYDTPDAGARDRNHNRIAGRDETGQPGEMGGHRRPRGLIFSDRPVDNGLPLWFASFAPFLAWRLAKWPPDRTE